MSFLEIYLNVAKVLKVDNGINVFFFFWNSEPCLAYRQKSCWKFICKTHDLELGYHKNA